jgi:hypothetical protein
VPVRQCHQPPFAASSSAAAAAAATAAAVAGAGHTDVGGVMNKIDELHHQNVQLQTQHQELVGWCRLTFSKSKLKAPMI